MQDEATGPTFDTFAVLIVLSSETRSRPDTLLSPTNQFILIFYVVYTRVYTCRDITFTQRFSNRKLKKISMYLHIKIINSKPIRFMGHKIHQTANPIGRDPILTMTFHTLVIEVLGWPARCSPHLRRGYPTRKSYSWWEVQGNSCTTVTSLAFRASFGIDLLTHT